jgi:hypothetical protein
MSETNSKIYVSASDVSDAYYCPHRLSNKIEGKSVNRYNKKASKRGNKAHEYQNRVGRDRRCFVATYLYGESDSRVRDLRVFRDVVLMPSIFGRFFVRFYYLLSPFLIHVCSKFPFVKKVFDRCISLLPF